MERLKYPLSHEWHVAVNRHSDERRAAGNEWRKTRFMYDAKTMADEVPRMVMLFRQERDVLTLRLHRHEPRHEKRPVSSKRANVKLT